MRLPGGRGAGRRAGIAVTATAVLCLLALAPSTAFARNLEIPTFLTPGLNQDNSPSAVPGGRPFELIDVFVVNQEPTAEELADGSHVGPVANLRNLRFSLSPGLIANATSFPRCTQEAFSAGACGTATQVGVASLKLSAGQATGNVPIFNLVPPPGMPAQFAFRALGSGVRIDFRVRSGGDYGVTAEVKGISEAAGLLNSSVRIWGVPGDPEHDALRFAGNGAPAPGPYPEPAPFRPLLSNPTSCDGPLVTTMETDTWQHPGQITSAPAFEAPSMGGCNQPAFDPTIEAKPTTDLADSPTGLDFRLHVPQIQDPNGSASAHVRTVRLALPAGLDVNPSAANGLGTCTPEQIGLAGVSSQRQLLRYDMPPTNFSGTFVVSYGGQTTAPIPATASRAAVTAALETLPGLAGNITLSGAQGGWIVSFTGALAGSPVAKLSGFVTANPSQVITVTGEAGSFKLVYAGAETSALPFNASDAEIQAALRAIPAFGLGNLFPGNVFVQAGGESGSTKTFLLIFAGDLAGTTPLLTASSSLTGPEAGVVIKQEGTPPPEVLSVAMLGGNAPGTPQFNSTPPSCPDSAKIGTVRIDSPAILDRPLSGDVYLASQGRNPFGSLLAFYLVAEDPVSGLALKLPGRLETDAASGRLVATVAEAPQLPFEDLHLELFKGTAAPLKTGLACGTFAVESAITPWTAPEAATGRPSDSFAIDRGAGAGACPANAASVSTASRFEAGTAEPSAGAYSPLIVKLSRQDGTRSLRGIDVTLPAGLLARVAGLQACPDGALAAATSRSGGSEQASPSCPAGSRIGSTEIAAGAGPTPYNLSGSAYLAGPYRGAPYSVAAVVPAVTGPFDLGTVVLRSALYVDRKTTRVHVVSDPLPTTLQGIPLDLRSVAMSLDARQFVKNPTSCNPMRIDGPEQSSQFQVGDCANVPFKPKLALSLSGGTKRGNHPALLADLSFPAKGDSANVAAVTLTLPKAVAIDKARIGALCAAAQADAGNCPATSAYGTAKVSTPLLSSPLQGKVFLLKTAAKLPGLAIALNGPVDTLLEGQLEATKAGALRVIFEKVPDVPVSKMTLELAGAKKGLLRNTGNLCARTFKAEALIDGQNGITSVQNPPLTARCKKKASHGGKAKRRAARRAAR